MPGVHHSAICTSDVERSLRLWRDGLGHAPVAGAYVRPSGGVPVELIGAAQ